MTNSKIVLCLMMLTFSSLTFAADSAEKQWSDRGLTAVQELKKLAAKDKKEKLNAKERCQLLLEDIYSKFADSEVGSFVKEDKTRMARVILRSNTDELGTRLNVTYQGDGTIGYGVINLAKGTTVTFSKKGVVLSDTQCHFVFPYDEPTKATVTAGK